jgi:hypothetical protein
MTRRSALRRVLRCRDTLFGVMTRCTASYGTLLLRCRDTFVLRQVMLWNGSDGTCVSKLAEPFGWAPLALLNIVYKRQRLLAVGSAQAHNAQRTAHACTRVWRTMPCSPSGCTSRA